MAEEIYEQGIDLCTQLEMEKSELLSKVYELRDLEQELKKGLSKIQEQHKELLMVSTTFPKTLLWYIVDALTSDPLLILGYILEA